MLIYVVSIMQYCNRRLWGLEVTVDMAHRIAGKRVSAFEIKISDLPLEGGGGESGCPVTTHQVRLFIKPCPSNTLGHLFQVLHAA